MKSLLTVILVFLIGVIQLCGQPILSPPESEVQWTWNPNSIAAAAERLELDAAGSDECSPAIVLKARDASRLFAMIGQRRKSIALLRRIMPRCTAISEKNERLRIRLELALAFVESSRPNEAAAELASIGETSSYPLDLQALASFVRGQHQFYIGQISQSVADYRASVEMYSQIGAQRDLVSANLALGYSLLFSNRFEESRQFFDESKRLAEEVGDPRGIAFALIATGTAYSMRGKHQFAREPLLKAAEMIPEGVDPDERIALFGSLAYLYDTFGDIENQKKFAFASLKYADLTENKAAASAVHLYYARLIYPDKRFDEAKAEVVKSIKLAKDVGNPFLEADCNRIRAEIALASGNTDEADFAIRTAERLAKTFGDTFLLAQISRARAAISIKQKRIDDARRVLKRSIEIERRIRNSVGEAESLYQLAVVEKDAGEFAAAIGLARESVRLTDEIAKNVAAENLKMSFVADVYDRYELLIGILADAHRKDPDGGYAAEALLVSENSRARVFREMMAMTTSGDPANVDPALNSREAELRAALAGGSSRLSTLLGSDTPDAAEISRIESEVRQIQVELDEVRAGIRRSNPVLASLGDSGGFDLEAYRKTCLNDNSVMIQFFAGESRGFAWFVTRDSLTIEEFPLKEVENLVTVMRRDISAPAEQPGDSIEARMARIEKANAELAANSAELSRILFAKNAELIRGRRLVIVADGKLHYLPFAALPFPGSDEGKLLLTETKEIVFEHSGASHQMLMSRPAGAINRDPLMILSDPVVNRYDDRLPEADAADADQLELELQRLSASIRESESIAEIVRVRESNTISGFDANRNRILGADLSRVAVFHFATHGVIDEKRPYLTGIAMSKYAPDGRSGDHMLRLGDLYGLKLDADLVVLSACETAVGDEIRGEGLESVSSAFFVAGARSVVASLWTVNDNSTQVLMSKFYSRLASGESAGSALRNAKIDMIGAGYKYPYSWAGFVLQGNPESRPALPRRPGKGYLLIGLLPVYLGLLLYLNRLKNYSATKL